MTESPHYTMLIQWSVADQAFVVSLPEWEGCAINPVTHGETYEEAANNGREALEALIASVRKHGEALPEARPLASVAL